MPQLSDRTGRDSSSRRRFAGVDGARVGETNGYGAAALAEATGVEGLKRALVQARTVGDACRALVAAVEPLGYCSVDYASGPIQRFSFSAVASRLLRPTSIRFAGSSLRNRLR